MIERNIVLASASPRRKELLAQIGLKFQVISSNEAEVIDPNLSVEDAVKSLASQKAMAVSKKIEGNFLIIGADTVVVCDRILGKPENEKDAINMLRTLRDKWHFVQTGIAIVDTGNNEYESFYETTRVKMRNYSDEEIYSYVKTGEPMDKAGSYGIQKLGALLVQGIEGCYFNVVGLPINKLGIALKKYNVTIL